MRTAVPVSATLLRREECMAGGFDDCGPQYNGLPGRTRFRPDAVRSPAKAP